MDLRVCLKNRGVGFGLSLAACLAMGCNTPRPSATEPPGNVQSAPAHSNTISDVLADPQFRKVADELDKSSDGKFTPEQLNRFRSAVGEVLQAHGFVTPVSIEGAAAVLVSARTRSRGDLVLMSARMTPGREVVLQVTPYAQVGSEWPTTGRLFNVGLEQETSEMRSQIQAKLASPSPE